MISPQEIVESIIEARPIKLDQKQIAKDARFLSDKIGQQAKKLKPGRKFRIDRVVASYQTKIMDVKGRSIDVDVEAVMSKNKSGTASPVMGGAMQTAISPVGPDFSIMLFLNGNHTGEVFTLFVNDNTVYEQIYKILSHEYTHVADQGFADWDQHWADEYKYGATKKSPKRLSGKLGTYADFAGVDDYEYYNRPDEVKAYMRNVVDQSIAFLDRNKDKLAKVYSPNKLIDVALKNSRAWRQVKDYMTPQNLNKIKKAVYTVIQDKGLV